MFEKILRSPEAGEAGGNDIESNKPLNTGNEVPPEAGSLADEFWAEMVKYLPPRDLFEEITPEEAQAMLDVGEDATLTEEEISRFSAALRAGQAERRAAQADLPDEETPPNLDRA